MSLVFEVFLRLRHKFLDNLTMPAGSPNLIYTGGTEPSSGPCLATGFEAYIILCSDNDLLKMFAMLIPGDIRARLLSSTFYELDHEVKHALGCNH